MEQIKELCNSLHLGDWVTKPVPVSGGLLHTMYAVETTKGKYAVKALNPSIMMRPDALDNYIRSERVARTVSNNVAALPAKTFGGKAIQNAGDQWFLVFDWVEGRRLPADELHADHCRRMGTVLADIHHTDFQEMGIEVDVTEVRPSIEWRTYLRKSQDVNEEWVRVFHENIDKLYEWDARSCDAEKRLGADRVMSHRDLDPKNVLWVEGNPVLIDWESAGFIHPAHDLVETALYWSGYDEARFKAFISGYAGKGMVLEADWEAVLANGFSGKLDWLEYNLKRSLWMECSDREEQELGTEQVIETIRELSEYGERVPQIVKWLQERN
ncbi:phosphotransferase [Rossellomorea sp. YZS02]|uniref:phosphotransferase n=1 Tax=Rossellomorea sp. YZS02 TaxID=3097358 RepID=UPI002A17D0A5|nr:phosphotransferase [Rossellomorea sp. YZS02]MDX8344634.1 phosphotransferase [Rossellomorea sp. YZS02]